jgi:iron complex outermembrane receptor protein
MKVESLGGILAVLALPVHAAMLTESDFLADLPVVLTVSKMAQPLQDSPAAVTIIDQDMIRASGYQDIPDLLRLVPGFSVAYTRDNNWAVGYHGFADAYSRRFQVLVDGRSIYSPHYGEVGWSTLPLAIEDIERIEVVRGPNAAVYGANAFFAIINIVSRDPSQIRGRLASVLAGEQNMAGAVLRYGGGEGDLRYRLSLSSQHRDRFEKKFVDTNGSVAQYYERTYTRFLNGRWDYQLSNTDELSAQIGLTSGDWNAGRDTEPLETRAYEPRSGYAQLRFNRAVSADEEWNVQFSHSYTDNGQSGFVGPFGSRYYTADVLVYPNIRQWRTQLDFSSMRRLNPDLRLVWGGELRHEAVESLGKYGTNDRQDGALANLFAHAEWQAGSSWLVQGGAQIGHHYFTGFEISPRLAVSYQLNPRHTLRWAVSRATRSPTFYEQDGNSALYNLGGLLVDQDIIPSSGLEPEVNTSTEIGYLGRWPEWGGQLDVRLYRDHVTDYIGQNSARIMRTFGPGESFNDKYFQYVNGGTLDVTGLDAQLVWKPHRDFSLHLAQSFMHVDASHDTVDDDMPESAPDWVTSLLANWRIAQGLSLSAAVYHTDRMMWLTEGDLTKRYTRADVRLAKQFKLGGAEAEWALGVQNLGDDYEEFRRQNIFTRRAYGSLRLAW